MKHRFIHSLALAVVVALPLVAQPKLTLSDQRIDLGVLYNGASKSAEIKLTNSGTDTLRIVNVQASCGCTTLKQPKAFLLPGESDVLKVEFNSTGFRGPSTKYVNITTNDPEHSYTSVTLLAEVREELQATNIPGIVWFGNVRVGNDAGISVAFKNLSNALINIKGIATDNPSITASPQRASVKPSEEVRIEFKVRPSKEGYANEQVFLETDSKNQPRVPVRISYIGVKPS
jgi:hypothetical protein